MPDRRAYSSLEDEELIRLFQNADDRKNSAERHGTFTVLVERYQKRIYFAARKMVGGNHDEADEIAQETFVKVYDALQTFRGEARLYTWLYQIMMNAVIQRARKRKVRQIVGLDDIANTIESSEADPHERMQQSETTRLIEAAIETLPPKQRRVFIMRFYEELPYEEIASIVGTSVGGLKANYFHAVRKIGDYLKASGKIPAELTLLSES
jgi:RNA polymerase sigma factor (sigma-70 family)